MLRLSRDFGKREKFAAVRGEVAVPLSFIRERSEFAFARKLRVGDKARCLLRKWYLPERGPSSPSLRERVPLVSAPQERGEGD